MKYFPDEPATGIWARYAVPAPRRGGRQADPESTYAMNGSRISPNIPASWFGLSGAQRRNLKLAARIAPGHCVVEGIQVYTVGIPCEKIQRAAQSD
jgi:hypothetical protein